jgi:GDPmannose 4,6-dehydratase
LNTRRDWGWAPDYVEAMWLMLQLPRPDDFVIATGTTTSLEDLLACAFLQFGLDWRDHVQVSPLLERPTDIGEARADPAKAKRDLHWVAKHTMPQVIARMTTAELGCSAPP